MEDKIVIEVTKRLKDRLNNDDKLKQKISIDHHVNVLKDVTILPNPKRGRVGIPRFCLTFGDAEQDIVVYRKDEKIELPFDDKYIRRAAKSFTSKRNSNHFRHIIIPLVIFEVKYGEITTHSLTHYSSIAQQIKDKMPEIAYNLVLINCGQSSPEKVTRHGRTFDWIIPIHIGKEPSNGDFESVSDQIYDMILRFLKYRTPLWFLETSQESNS